MSINKGQVLIVTLFVLGSSMIVTYMLLMPVISQSLKVKTLLNGFQALANAETGIEVGNYYALKNINLYGPGGGGSGFIPIENSPTHCGEFIYYYIGDCNDETISDGIRFQSHIDVAIIENPYGPLGPAVEIVGTRNISQGVYKNTSRILQFIFIPAPR
jgi:hypothetical protein